MSLLNHYSIAQIEQRQCLKQKHVTSHVNCLEETGHHVDAHDMWHLLFSNDCGIEQVEQRRHKSRIMHCSMFHHNMISDKYLHFCENRALIQRLTPLGPHTRHNT